VGLRIRDPVVARRLTPDHAYPLPCWQSLRTVPPAGLGTDAVLTPQPGDSRRRSCTRRRRRSPHGRTRRPDRRDVHATGGSAGRGPPARPSCAEAATRPARTPASSDRNSRTGAGRHPRAHTGNPAARTRTPRPHRTGHDRRRRHLGPPARPPPRRAGCVLGGGPSVRPAETSSPPARLVVSPPTAVVLPDPAYPRRPVRRYAATVTPRARRGRPARQPSATAPTRREQM